MNWETALRGQLDADRALIELVLGGGVESDSPFEAFVRHQPERFGIPARQARLPEHFRGPVDRARVCFLGPHVELHPEELAPTVAADIEEYLAYYRERPERRDPYGHYQAIMEGAPWLSTELVHWPCEKELALQVLKSPRGPAAVEAALDLTWAMLRDSPVQVLVLTGNDAVRWVLPHLGARSKGLPGVTQLHGQTLGRFPLPGASGREFTAIASFHWSKEMPMFVRKVAGLGDLTVREAISGARRMVREAIGKALGD